MDACYILNFLSELKENNNREWFALNKHKYEHARNDFEKITNALIAGISQFDEDIKTVQAKDCIFRIYRDIRFHDKTPYKTHMGTYIASHGGRKSPRGGYYLHIEPGSCFISGGIWHPEPPVLKALRQTVFENIDEFKEIVENKEFKKYFGTEFYEEDMLKTAPKGYPKDFSDMYYLKLKHYIANFNVPDSFFDQPDYLAKLVQIYNVSYPLNCFLNYTVDEVMNF